MTRHLAVRFTAALLAILAVLALALDSVIKRAFLEDLTATLTTEATAVRHALPDGPELGGAVRSLGQDLDVRITVIRTDGRVVADSSRASSQGIENHADRPEVKDALSGRIGVSSRLSETVGIPFRYVALPPERGLIVRVAMPLTLVDARLGRVRMIIGAGFAAAAIAGLMVVWLVSRGITRPVARMTDSISRRGGSSDRLPEEGTRELVTLVRTINRMADDLRSQLQQIDDDRELRDAVLDAMDDGILLTDGPEVVYANRASRRVLGKVPKQISRLLPSKITDVIEEARRNAGAASGELMTGPAGTRVLITALPIGPARTVVVLRDVTDARRVEAMRRDFVADASHELKTPVAAIQAGAETLQRAIRDDPPAAQRFAIQLGRDAARLSRLVTDLLDLSRLEAADRDAAGPQHLDRIAADEVRRLRHRATEAQIEVETSLSPATVTGWRKDLALLVRNLFDNAIRYTPAGGNVEVSVRASGTEAVMTVRDTGVGIPTRDLPRVFERFYRVDPARSRETGGTGLGLSIARHIVEEHGGTIEAESELGRGSTFTVKLPLTGEVAAGEPPDRHEE